MMKEISVTCRCHKVVTIPSTKISEICGNCFSLIDRPDMDKRCMNCGKDIKIKWSFGLCERCRVQNQGLAVDGSV